MIRVFITYAWESDPLKQEAWKEAIWQLAGWIQNSRPGEIEVITDHLYAYRPPPKGFPNWMQDEIEAADVVLVICTERYHAAFEKKIVEETGGAGATFEGVIVRQEMLELRGTNNKFFPIIPDGGKVDHIPKILRPYNGGHCFPSKQDGIVRLVCNDNPTHQKIDNSAINESIKLEQEIVKVVSIQKPEMKMEASISIQVLVRSFLSLNEVDKIKVARAVGAYQDSFKSMANSQRDKEVFKVIKEKNLLGSLWTEINRIKPFESDVNPFN